MLNSPPNAKPLAGAEGERVAELEAQIERLKSDYETQNLIDLNASLDVLHKRNKRIAELESQVRDYEGELERHSTDRVNQRRQAAELAASLEIAREALQRLADYENGADDMLFAREVLAQLSNPSAANSGLEE